VNLHQRGQPDGRLGVVGKNEKNVEPKGISPPWAAIPLTAAHMPNSLTPKKTLRPAGSAWK